MVDAVTGDYSTDSLLGLLVFLGRRRVQLHLQAEHRKRSEGGKAKEKRRRTASRASGGFARSVLVLPPSMSTAKFHCLRRRLVQLHWQAEHT